MIGTKRLMNVEESLRQVVKNKIPGDFIECGVWRGGGSLYARAVLHALGVTDRKIWLADSFSGLPAPRTKNDDIMWSRQVYLRVPLDEVKENFRAFGLLDDQVQFCEGYFVDSLPKCPIKDLAVLRMDGDMYESTMDQLFNLYSKLRVGGILIIDDFSVPPCRRAINDFRKWHDINESIVPIGDDVGVYWVKEKLITLKIDYYHETLKRSTTRT